MKKSSPPKTKKFPAAKQRRLDLLLDKNSEGTISDKQKKELVRLVREAEELMVENARRLAEFSEHDEVGLSPKAVPVTVWVQPQAAEP